MDLVSLTTANRLASNSPGEAGLEIGRPGLTLEAVGAPATISAVGPSLRVWLDGSEVTGNRSYRLTRSFHARSGIGGTGQGALGDRTLIPTHGLVGPELALGDPMPAGPAKISVLPGPQIEHLASGSWEKFLNTAWKIGARSDRMGVRLEGPTLEHSAKGYNIVSDGIALGSVQLPGDGNPIVLAADRQTTGGYPKFAVIARADMSRFSQIPPGATVRFRSCTPEDAVRSLRELYRRLDMLRLAPANRDLDSATLLSQNLIDGVVLG
jgi:allophanate hydrolase subunit 2